MCVASGKSPAGSPPKVCSFVWCSASGMAMAGDDIVGIDLGTTNSCVSVMEGKVRSDVSWWECYGLRSVE